MTGKKWEYFSRVGTKDDPTELIFDQLRLVLSAMWMQRNVKLNATDFDGFKKKRKKTIENEKAADFLMA